MDRRRSVAVRHKMTGTRLRALRLRFDLSLEECAQAIGLTPQGMLQRERGEKPLLVGEFWRFCHYLGVAPREAYGVGASPSGRLPSARALRLYRKLLGAALAEARAGRGWGEQEAAGRARLSQERLRGSELGDEELAVAEVEALAELYGVPASELLGGIRPPAGERPEAREAGEPEPEEQLGLDLRADVVQFLQRPDAERCLRAAMILAELDDAALSAVGKALASLGR